MIFPQEKDIGRAVVYRKEGEKEDSGLITTFNEYFVFVRYAGETHSRATRRQDLEWA